MVSNTNLLASLTEKFPSFQEYQKEGIARKGTDGIHQTQQLFDLLLSFGKESGQEQEVQTLIESLEERINLVKHKLKFIGAEKRPKVLVLTSVIPPIYGTSDYFNHLVETAGGNPYSTEELAESDPMPDLILVLSKEFEKLFGTVGSLVTTQDWQQMPAVKNNRVFLINGNHHLRGMDLNVATDIELLGQLFFPEYLTFSEPGENWVQFEL